MFVKYVLVDKDCKYGWKSDKQIPGNSYSRCIQNPKIFKKKNKDESSVCVGVNPGNPGNDCVITELPRTRTLTIQSV